MSTGGRGTMKIDSPSAHFSALEAKLAIEQPPNTTVVPHDLLAWSVFLVSKVIGFTMAMRREFEDIYNAVAAKNKLTVYE
jgi:hypothetical protein